MSTITVSKLAISNAVSTTLQTVLSTEKRLGTDEINEINLVTQAVTPLIEAQTQELLTSVNPAIQTSYLQGLVGAVTAAVEGCNLEAIAAQKELIVTTIFAAINILAAFVKTAAIVPALAV